MKTTPTPTHPWCWCHPRFLIYFGNRENFWYIWFITNSKRIWNHCELMNLQKGRIITLGGCRVRRILRILFLLSSMVGINDNLHQGAMVSFRHPPSRWYWVILWFHSGTLHQLYSDQRSHPPSTWSVSFWHSSSTWLVLFWYLPSTRV